MSPLHIALLGLALTGLLLAPGGAGADPWADPGTVDEAICAVSYAGQDLTGVQGQGFTLDGVSFAASDLTGADLSGASLVCVDDDDLTCDGRCVDLGGADLTGARFLGANLTGADWIGTVADGADFGSATLDDARGRATKDGTTSFAGARLAGASLLRVDFLSSDPAQYRTDFSGADLRSTRADCLYEQVVIDLGDGETETIIVTSECPDFGGADFSGADLRSANWTKGRYDDAIFVDANLDGAIFRGGDFVGADFSNQLLDEASIRDGLFIAESPDTAGAYVTALFGGADLAGSELSGAILSDPAEPVDLDDDGDLCDEAIGSVDLSGIVGTDLSDATLRAVQAPKIDLSGFTLVETDLTLADLRCADLTAADLARARLGGVDLGGATLGGAMPGDGVVALAAPNASGACTYPAAPGDELPQPLCPRFDGAQAQRITLSGARINGATFVGADLSDADLTTYVSSCQDLPVDPDLNQGLSTKAFCPDFTGATLSGARFTEARMQGPDFGSASALVQGGFAPLDLVDAITTCITGQVPGENEGDPPVAADFCARFQGAVLERAIFRDATLAEAEFGCLEPEAGSTAFPPCTALQGADFSGVSALGSSWIAVDLTAQDDGNDVQATTFVDADLSEATLSCQGFSYEVIDDMVDPPIVTNVVASAQCNDFSGSILTPGFVAASAVLDGVDWAGQDLTGAILSDAAFGCFEYAYQDESDETQVIERCSSLAGADLTDADLSGATFEGTDLSGATLVNADLGGTDFDAETRFAADYVPDPGATGDAVKDECTTSGTPTDLTGADLQGADLSAVIDFGGTCIVVDESTIYSDSTTGLTADMQSRMSLVPEPSAAAASAAALGTLAWLRRRGRRRTRA